MYKNEPSLKDSSKFSRGGKVRKSKSIHKSKSVQKSNLSVNNKLSIIDNKCKYPDLLLHIVFIPYVIYDGNKTKRFGKNKLTEYIIKKKLSQIKKIIYKILWECKIKKYIFNTKTNLIEIDLYINKGLYDFENGTILPSKKYDL